MIGFPKPRPKLLDKRAKAAKLAEQDRQQRAICKERSGGRCEMRESVTPFASDWPSALPTIIRCNRRATENHHLIGGWGRRNRGKSLLAEHRLEVCQRCHEEITHHVLVPAVEADLARLAASVVYERIR